MNKIDQAFILAAGHGKRLRPYTDTLPKPLIPIDGTPIIDGVLERLTEGGMKDVTINLHYRADILESHLKGRSQPQIHFSYEEEILETGGGIKKGLKAMRQEPFFVVSGDSLWTDGPGGSALARMQEAWNPEEMDILILLQPVSRMVLTPGVGDYDIDANGRAIRQADKSGAYMWSSVRICSPSIFEHTPDGAFSFLELLDKAEAAGRLHALIHDGDWYHITTPQDLDTINEALAGRKIYA